MTTNDMQVGDVVALKSGGPEMTIESIDDGVAWCVWFAGKKQEASGFKVTSLRKVVPQGGSGFRVERG